MIDLFSMSQKLGAYQLLAIEFICCINKYKYQTTKNIILILNFFYFILFRPQRSIVFDLKDYNAHLLLKTHILKRR